MLMFLRNKLFDWKILPTKSFNVPIVSVGNLSYGGTGKTPHIEYIIRLLQNEYNLATLSRGYGRNTSGCVIANESSSYHDIGDKSLQYQQKFSQLNVAVDESRTRGIKVLFNTYSDLDCILLDDAFQHRYVKPGLQILLTDYHNLYVNDYPIPTGSLREFKKGAKRADIIIVTKTAPVFSPFTKRRLEELLKPKKHQKLYFSHICYGKQIALTDFKETPNKKKYYSIVMFSSIANSYPLQEHLRSYCNELIIMNFPNHHKYTYRDIEKINFTYDDIFSRNKVIFTTEKDAMRLIKTNLFKKIKHLPIYYIPIEVKFHLGGDKNFNKQIVDYVKKNQRDGKLYKK
jgi:tetraacyldisaccharide 4'-kinase